MARFDISLTGDKELQAMLATMTDKLERRVISQAMRKAAKTVQQTAIAKAPARQVRYRQGAKPRERRRLAKIAQRFARLRNTFTLKALKRSRRRVGYAVWTGTRQQLGISGKYYYPAHVEWGHGPPRGSHGRGGRTPAHAYLRPALKQNEGALLSQLATDIRAGIEKEAGSTSTS